MIRQFSQEPLRIALVMARWAALVTPLALATGSACALFLWLLDRATELRVDNPALLYLLPAGGAAIALLYRTVGHSAAGGNDLIVDEIHEPAAGRSSVPFRMAPLVLVGSVATHLFGGSAGREGTAVQMGGGIASLYARLLPRRLGLGRSADRRTLLMSGVAAGFGGVFGTPLAGAVFALEVPALGRMSYAAALPCLVAAVVADRACAWWGIHHTVYPQVSMAGMAGAGSGADMLLLGKVALGGAAFGLAARFFSDLVHGLGEVFRRTVSSPILRPVAGGILVIALVQVAGTRDYLGLGVSSGDPSVVTILSAFREDGAATWSWLWKTVFTTVTLGAGFKGGEVTPLFYIGATLGNALSHLLSAPTVLMAALGFAAVFAGATNTPLACTVMAVELFGPAAVVHFGVACFVAYAFSGHSGIYLSQRIATSKFHDDDSDDAPASLRTAMAERRSRKGPRGLASKGGESTPETGTEQTES